MPMQKSDLADTAQHHLPVLFTIKYTKVAEELYDRQYRSDGNEVTGVISAGVAKRKPPVQPHELGRRHKDGVTHFRCKPL